ncbi:MAG TPA: inositol-3-phosphate synthase, partial [Nocardioidaceae bacterium]|nr:inositol-3-phosphate synthase [Nocardioidaceae bacterium]
LNLEYKLEVWDSPNSAGIIIDAVRAAKIALDRGIGGPILSASTYLMKSPPVQMADDKGREQLEAFIRGDVER